MTSRGTVSTTSLTKQYATAVPDSATGMYTYMKRIRSPSATDVLSGRGGSVNQHPGNIQFRQWVNERKYDYNLAPSKVEKAQICREVVAKVRNQTPPGKFLGRDESSVGGGNWWIELDDERIMAKTSQALREGAPKIREEHQDEVVQHRLEHQQQQHHHSTSRSNTTTIPSFRARPVTRHHPTKTTSTTGVKRPHAETLVSNTAATSNKAASAASPVLSSSKTTSTTHSAASSHSIRSSRIPVASAATSTRKGPIYNSSVPVNAASSDITSRLNHPMAAMKRVRVEYLGHQVKPTDESPVIFPATRDPVEQIVEEYLLPNSVLSNEQDRTDQRKEDFATMETPPLQPVPVHSSAAIDGSSVFDLNNTNNSTIGLSFGSCPSKGGLQRTHSLALSDIQEWSTTDFVNPFENEDEDCLLDNTASFSPRAGNTTHTNPNNGNQINSKSTRNSSTDSSSTTSSNLNGNNNNNNGMSLPPLPPPRVGLLRESSTSSNGDFGGIGALLRPPKSFVLNSTPTTTTTSATVTQTDAESLQQQLSSKTNPLNANENEERDDGEEKENNLGFRSKTSSRYILPNTSNSNIDDGWYQRTTSVSSVLSTTSFDPSNTVSSWLIDDDGAFDNGNSNSNIGLDTDDIFANVPMPVSP